MSDRLPDFLEPVSLCRRGAVMAGEVPLAPMGRLAALGVAVAGVAAARLAFHRDDQGRAVVDVGVSATLHLTCQRCLEDLPLAVAEERRLALVESEAEAERLPEDLEPLLVGEAPLRTSEVLEDELMLSLPIVPAHPEGVCATPAGAGPGAGEAGGGRPSPFAGLEVLKGRRTDD